jgi:Zn finger protein HypA/HybF involved in hydrogenase expression
MINLNVRSEMALQILQKQLDESSHCPLCQASMYWVDAEQFEQDVQFHECSHCQHRVFKDTKMTCHCDQCTKQRKKLLQQTRLQEQRQFKSKDQPQRSLEQLSFLHKLFLLSLLDDYARDDVAHDEYIHWDQIKYQPITPNWMFQSHLIKQLHKDGILNAQDQSDEPQCFYLNIRLDGYSDPSLFSVAQQLRHWFYENLSLGIPFRSADEVKDVLFQVLYQEIIQFTQFYCRTWGIQIAGSSNFQAFCYRLMDSLAIGQIYYLIQTALEYLYKQKALQPRNEKFINTNLLKKTLEQYRERALAEKWETSMLPRPYNIPYSKMSHILFNRFLGYDEQIFVQPVWKAWRKIEPRLNFYSVKRCMYCGSNDLSVDYDAADYVSLICQNCKHQDHYFTR